MTRLLGILSTCLLVLTACGGGGGSEPDDAGPRPDSSSPDAFAPDAFVPDMGIELDPSSYRTAYMEMICRTYFECRNRHTVPHDSYLGAFASAEECASSSLAPLLARLFLPLPESLDDGHIAFDAERAAECLESEAAYYCDETSTRPRIDDPCEHVFEGLREDGETCREGECAEGFSCVTGGSCDGTCMPVMLLCPPCEPDEYCEGVSGTCQPLLAAGESCANDDMCDEGLVCDAPRMGTGDCVAVGSRAEGAACEAHDVCDAGLYCEANQCTAYSVEAAGESCGGATICEAQLICFETTAVCEAPHAVGDPCVEVIGDCGADLYCDQATDRCAEQKTNGTSCAEGFECLSFYCPSATMECTPPPACGLP